MQLLNKLFYTEVRSRWLQALEDFVSMVENIQQRDLQEAIIDVLSWAIARHDALFGPWNNAHMPEMSTAEIAHHMWTVRRMDRKTLTMDGIISLMVMESAQRTRYWNIAQAPNAARRMDALDKLAWWGGREKAEWGWMGMARACFRICSSCSKHSLHSRPCP